MSTVTLTPTKLRNAVWYGVLHKTDAGTPEVRVTHLDTEITGIKVTENADAGHWVLEVPIPPETIADGVQVFIVSDATDGEKLGSFVLMAGEMLDDDIRAEVALLRAELDMLKRAFRHHCVETL